MTGLFALQALLFAACAAFSLVPQSEVECRFNVPVAAISPAQPPVTEKPPPLPVMRPARAPQAAPDE